MIAKIETKKAISSEENLEAIVKAAAISSVMAVRLFKFSVLKKDFVIMKIKVLNNNLSINLKKNIFYV